MNIILRLRSSHRFCDHHILSLFITHPLSLSLSSNTHQESNNKILNAMNAYERLNYTRSFRNSDIRQGRNLDGKKAANVGTSVYALLFCYKLLLFILI